ncbi:MAG TPA: phosphatidate cytidylyltransferase [Chlamydiales bacterium]|nr:phosphatidate cytidylyltransferase [Chlamydiales bacterium]
MAEFNDLKKRFLTSFVAIVVLALLLIFAYAPFMDWLLFAVVAFVSFASCLEWVHLAKGKEFHLHKSLLSILSIGQVFFIFLGVKTGFNLLPIFFFFFALLLLFLDHFRKVEGALAEIAISALHLLYLAVPLGLILWILYGTMPKQDGRIWTFYLIAVTKITDVAAYFCGRIFGRRKLAPIISPKKTWEGGIGGFVLAIIVSVIFSFFSNEETFRLPLSTAIFLGIAFGIFSQLGDLSESLLKRDVKIKDSSGLPGLGGIMDTLDSLQWNILILFFFLQFEGF